MIYIDKNTTFLHTIRIIQHYAVPWQQCQSWIQELERYACPDQWIVDFDTLTFRQLIELQEKIVTYEDLLTVPLQVLQGWSSRKVLMQKAFDLVALSYHTQYELQRITKLFQSIAYQPSYEEERAGIKKLDFGFFGTVDWYARRMGISNHDEVVKLPWMIIYQCMKIDFENLAFQRRYRSIVNKQNK